MAIYKYEVEFTGTRWFGLKKIAATGILQARHAVDLEKDFDGICKHLRKAHGIRNVAIQSLKEVPSINLSEFTVKVLRGLCDKIDEEQQKAACGEEAAQ